MCNLCIAQRDNLSAVSVNPNSLCVPHYQEWAAEKNAFEVFDTSDYLGIINL